MSKKQKILKILIFIGVVIFFIYLTKEFFPLFRDLLTEEGRESFKFTIDGMGFKGILIIIGLMCVQILVPILPGEPIEILAGMCFGSFKGLIIILLGVIISTALIVFLVKILGKRFIYTFVSKDKINKIENSKFFKNKKKVDLLIFFCFFIPGLPKDILIYIAALLPININRFLIISTIARVPSIISSTIIGSNFVDGNIVFGIAIYIAILVITVSSIYFMNRKDKNIVKMVDVIK